MKDSYSFDAIGTRWRVDYRCDTPLRELITATIDQYDAVYSRFRSDSVVARMADAPGTFILPPHANELFALYRSLYDATAGRMTPLIGSSMTEAGYDKDYSLQLGQRDAIKPALPWDDAMSYDAAAHTLTTYIAVQLDIGAAGKGQLIDLLSTRLADAGATDIVIDAGGDILNAGTTRLKVGLENPTDLTQVIGIIELDPGHGLAGSAINRRAWGDGLHHIIDGIDARPVGDIIATWVVAPSAMLADGIATALFFCGPDALASVCRFDFVVLDDHHRVAASEACQPGLFTATLKAS